MSSIFGRLFGLGKRVVRKPIVPAGGTLFLHGKAGNFLEIGRTSRFQAGICEIVAEKTGGWYRHECMVSLLVEDGNLRERQAVAVEIDGKRVGYLPSHVATQYREWLHAWHLSDFGARCRGVIINSPCGRGSAARYHVKLDLEVPFRMTIV